MSAKIVEVLMPLMGEGVNEATLVKWLKKVGDRVEKAEPLLEVSTDKVDTEIPSTASGFLAQTLVAEGSQVEVNAVLAMISDQKDAVISAPSASPSKTSATKSAAAAQPASSASTSTNFASSSSATMTAAGSYYSGHMRSSPLVRKMAKDHAVDVAMLAGSGLQGRVTKQDLLDHMLRKGTGSSAGIVEEKLQTQTKDGQEFLDGVAVRREKMSKMRQLIAEHMVRSVRVSPHVTTTFEIDVHRVAQILDQHKANFLKREGFKLTYTAVFIHAAIQAIKQHPLVNVSIDGDEILFKDQINMGCAVALPTGLIVPVIKNAGDLNLVGVARKLNDLVTRARNKKLLPEDVQGGTFSVTNPGGWGSIHSNPIINQPQVAILGIGAVVKRPVVVDDSIAIRPMVMISLTFDHRIVDGEGGAKYLATLKEILENYNEMPN